MNYFIDFEANSPSNEIISIGCITEYGDEFYSLVKPTTPLSGYVQRITHLTQKELNKACDIDSVVWELRYWIVRTYESNENRDFNWNDCIFYCYGNSDIDFIKASLKTIEVMESYEALAALAIRLKDYCITVTRKFGQTIGLLQGVNYFKENRSEQTHNALDDASLLLELWVDVENMSEDQLEENPFDVAHKLIVRTDKDNNEVFYETLDDALQFCLNQIPKNLRNNKTRKNMKKKLVKAAKSRSKYFGFYWELR